MTPEQNLSCKSGTTYNLELEVRRLRKELAEKNERIEVLENLSVTDDLTGVFNRRRFNEDLRQAVSYNRRYGRRSAILFIDMDRMKQINDKYGHITGDQAIIFLARLLEKSIRASDLLYRYGGDEFVIILADTAPEDAQQKMLALDQIITSSVFTFGECSIHLSASIGCEMVNGNTNADKLLKAADEDMYEKKRSA